MSIEHGARNVALPTINRQKNKEILEKKGKEKFDFTDMHFALGPAEKIFGPGGVRVRTQGTAELRFGATLKNIDNPSLPIRNRKMTTMNFDEKINLNVNGKVGDKVNMNLNYNTDATFDFDAQNFKLRYEGKEDEIIKLVEGGNVRFHLTIRSTRSIIALWYQNRYAVWKVEAANSAIAEKIGKQKRKFKGRKTAYSVRDRRSRLRRESPLLLSTYIPRAL